MTADENDTEARRHRRGDTLGRIVQKVYAKAGFPLNFVPDRPHVEYAEEPKRILAKEHTALSDRCKARSSVDWFRNTFTKFTPAPIKRFYSPGS